MNRIFEKLNPIAGPALGQARRGYCPGPPLAQGSAIIVGSCLRLESLNLLDLVSGAQPPGNPVMCRFWDLIEYAYELYDFKA